MRRRLYFRSRLSFSRPVGVAVSMLAALLLSATLLAGGCSDHDSLALDLGPASTLRLEDLWREVAEGAEFDAGSALLTRLRLECAPSGWLVSVSMGAYTSDGRSVDINWHGSYGSDDQNVRLSATIRPETTPRAFGVGMLGVLAAIDCMGPKNMIDVPSGSTPGDFYFMTLQEEHSGEKTLDPRALAYTWSEGGFIELASDDSRRNSGTFLALYPMVVTERSTSTVPTSVAGEGAVSYATSLKSMVPIFFVLAADK